MDLRLSSCSCMGYLSVNFIYMLWLLYPIVRYYIFGLLRTVRYCYRNSPNNPNKLCVLSICVLYLP